MSGGYRIFAGQLAAAVSAFPSLSLVIQDGRAILKGRIDIVDGDGKHWEYYDIEIHGTEAFSNEFPMLFETSGKIPKIADWHVYEDTGSCCLKIKPEEILRCKNGITVNEFIQEEVIPYLFNQTHRRVEGYYVNGEYGHGTWGLLQYYANELNTGDDYKYTLELIKYIGTHDRPHRTSMCFCGKKIKYRHCHKAVFEKLKGLGDEILAAHHNWIVAVLRPVA